MWNTEFLPINKYSRPGMKRIDTQFIVVHFSEGPGQSARQVRRFLEQRNTFGGYTFLVDDKEVIQLCNIDEMTPHVGGTLTDEMAQILGPPSFYRGYSIQNWKTIGICYCHNDATGTPEDATYQRLLNKVVYLMLRFDVPLRNVKRHFDITGKICPGYFTRTPQAWLQFKKDIDQLMDLR